MHGLYGKLIATVRSVLYIYQAKTSGTGSEIDRCRTFSYKYYKILLISFLSHQAKCHNCCDELGHCHCKPDSVYTKECREKEHEHAV
mgnify:FL=1|jgi:hypothetical protein